MKTINIQETERYAHFERDRRLPVVVTHSRPKQAQARSWVGDQGNMVQRSLLTGCDVTSIPGYVIQKNSSRGAKHGPSERHKMY